MLFNPETLTNKTRTHLAGTLYITSILGLRNLRKLIVGCPWTCKHLSSSPGQARLKSFMRLFAQIMVTEVVVPQARSIKAQRNMYVCCRNTQFSFLQIFCLTAAQRRLFGHPKTFSVFPLLSWMQDLKSVVSEINMLTCGTQQGQFVMSKIQHKRSCEHGAFQD